jgi:hypothetical protein
MQRVRNWLGVAAISCAIVAGWQVWSSGQQPATGKGKAAADPNRLEFEVVHSFDAKYEGDTPGHMGRAGGLEHRRPRVALGDPIYRGDEKVGSVTGLTWNRTNGSLDIEFDPADDTRICVGDAVWVMLDSSMPARAIEPQRGK